MNTLQDSIAEKGFDPYRKLSEKEMNYRTLWSIKNFLELDFSIVPDLFGPEDENSDYP
ncbi:hypothetical protein D3C86_2250500 [compost metagenome]